MHVLLVTGNTLEGERGGKATHVVDKSAKSMISVSAGRGGVGGFCWSAQRRTQPTRHSLSAAKGPRLSVVTIEVAGGGAWNGGGNYEIDVAP